MLANDAALHEVGLDGAALDAAAKGLVHCNMATVSLDMARAMTAAHAERGIGYVAAPVFGRPNVAAQGQLLVIAAGAADALETLKPLLGAVGRRVEIVGDKPEQANLFKIAGNFMIVSVVETLGEAFALLRKGGVDHARFQEVMASSLFAAPLYQNYGKLIVDETFDPPGFRLVLGLKDVNLARSAAAELGSFLPLGDLMRDTLEAAIAGGWGEKDLTAATALLAMKSGLRCLADNGEFCYDLRMTVDEIKNNIAKLSDKERAKLRAWWDELDTAAWTSKSRPISKRASSTSWLPKRLPNIRRASAVSYDRMNASYSACDPIQIQSIPSSTSTPTAR